MMNEIKSIAIAAALTAIGVQAALAQEGPTPSRSVESFQAWTVECTSIAVAPEKAADDAKKEAKTKSAEKFRKICEAVQTYTNKKSGNEVARLAFGYDGEDKAKRKLVAGIRTLVDVSFENKPAIMADDKELLSGSFTRCARIHCLGRFDVDTKKLDTLKKAEKLSFQYPVSNGRTIRINVSSAGLDDALAALAAK